MYKVQCSTWVGPPPVPHTLKLALLWKHLSLLIETEMESEELIKVRKCTTLLDKKEDKKRESKVKKQKIIAKVFWNNLKV